MRIDKNGFTIVELLIVIVVIGVIAGIVIGSYSSAQKQALITKRNSDLTVLYKAILNARTNSGKTLSTLTGRGWTEGPCSNVAPYGGNTANVEPKNLPKTHDCWTTFNSTLTVIANAALTNLDQLRAGDSNGNPYMFDENEGEGNLNPVCTKDILIYYNGDGTANRTVWKEVPFSVPACM